MRVKQSTYAGLRDDILDVLPERARDPHPPGLRRHDRREGGSAPGRLQDPGRAVRRVLRRTSDSDDAACWRCSTSCTTSSPAAPLSNGARQPCAPFVSTSTGFASFREPTAVDFTDADYFALVGPTGSGKSTVIDAITFALYGTAHRWERANAIAYALAPTANRCTVSLIFDVGGQRYQVVREVRRSGANTIQQKNARLERFADPTALQLRVRRRPARSSPARSAS